MFFEAPHRIRRTLEQLLGATGDRQAAVGRELTKLHEEIARGPLSSLLERLPPKPLGEFTVVVAGAVDTGDAPGEVIPQQIFADFCRMTDSGVGRREAITALANKHRLRSREVYAAIERIRHS